jgi:aryl-alcohol dehydrogenase-like predicted oxidoreductase
MNFAPRTLGRTGLAVGPLGVAASYGVPCDAVERAFDAGVNYLYWGSIRRPAFGRAIRNLHGSRDRLVIVVQSYTRVAALMGWSLARALQTLRLDFADILLLGLWNSRPPESILDAARALRARGLTRYLAISSHNRRFVSQLANGTDIDVVHFRYNAAHPGAETDIFPHLTANRAGTVSFTATSWGQLLKPRPHEHTPTASDCYRFVLTRPEVDICLTGPANAAHMDEALKALRLGPMNENELAWMRRVGHSSSRG